MNEYTKEGLCIIKMDKKLKIALIGAGGIARGTHLPAFKRIDNIEVVAVCDILEDRAKQVAEMFDIPLFFRDYHDVFKIEGLDAVDICTPNYLHSVISCEALENGLNVFCEKPDAISVSEAERMKEASERSGKVLMVMRNNRYWATAQYLKTFIEDGKMGEIYAARCGFIRRRGVPGRGGWFTTKSQSGGGPLIDLGVHMIDMCMYLMGNPKPVSVSGCTYNKFANSSTKSDSFSSKYGDKVDGGTFDVEDLAMGFIRFEDGSCMQVEFSWASNIEKEQHYYEFRGTKAGSSWSTLDHKLKIFSEEYGDLVNIYPLVDDSRCMQIHEANLRHFADVLLNGAEPMFTPQQGVNMIKILESLYKSAEEGREISLI